MSVTIKTIPEFDRRAKRLAKKHKSLKEDLRALVASLTENPTQGVSLGENTHKVRMAVALTEEFGKGFSTGTLYYMRQFYLTFPEIFATPWRILSWSHYKRIMQVSSEAARNWYIKEASEQMWSYATLNRNISTQYYERLLMSQQKEPVVAEMKALTRDFESSVRASAKLNSRY